MSVSGRFRPVPGDTGRFRFPVLCLYRLFAPVNRSGMYPVCIRYRSYIFFLRFACIIRRRFVFVWAGAYVCAGAGIINNPAPVLAFRIFSEIFGGFRLY